MEKVYMVQAILRIPAELVESKSVGDWSRVLGAAGLIDGYREDDELETYEQVAEFLYHAWVTDNEVFSNELPEDLHDAYEQIDDSLRVWTDEEHGEPVAEVGFPVGHPVQERKPGGGGVGPRAPRL
jgi:hypothetical protein